MKHIILILLAGSMLVNFSAYSQKHTFKKPNYKKIKRVIKHRHSKFYYPALMKRYLKADTTLTLKERRYLYYGYVFQDTYFPYGTSNYIDSLKPLLNKKQPTVIELSEIIRLADSALLENPFDLRMLNYQLYAYELLSDKSDFDKKINQMKIIVDAMISSGNGLTKETAFYVIFITHEYDLLNILGFDFGGTQSLIEHYDYLKLADNSEQIDGLYFDITPCLNSLNQMFK